MRVAPADLALPIPSDTATARLEPPRAPPREGGAPPGVTFASLVEDAVRGASERDAAAVAKVQALATGQSDDLHGTMIAVKEAEISTKLVGSIRNKLLDAFHELWRTSV
jgi:flagellar hook-basal body complex protein FliE